MTFDLKWMYILIKVNFCSFKVEESAIRIEKLKKAESKNDANSWDPTPKSVVNLFRR